MGTLLNNSLSQKLAGIQDDPFVKAASASGQASTFQNIDVNSVQGILSEQGRQGIENGLMQLPANVHDHMLVAFGSLVTTLQAALSSSITHIFMLSAGLMLVAFVVSFFVKEIPLKHHAGDDETTPSPAA